ncbi:unnamed protein product [Ranitomeya imitator]|uniref:Receptor ligand binding region domain-containing protein n=1 Tax=Ranitomeya imitator TaxID=111125 RepID=A0ABN9MRQ1_9NEOB|nr:unnamed protein product [Ranitomeya imitator]
MECTAAPEHVTEHVALDLQWETLPWACSVSLSHTILATGTCRLHGAVTRAQRGVGKAPEGNSHNFLSSSSRFHFESYQHLQALMFAVEEINKNVNILPNISTGFQAFDSCTMLQQDLEGTLKVLSGFGGVIPNYRCQNKVPLSSVIGHSISTHSMVVAHILGLYRYVQISHFSTSSLLSDRSQFPSFFRTIPSDTFQSQGLAQLVHHFDWTWVGLLAVDNDYGQNGIQLVKKEIAKTGACVAFTETIKRGQPDRNAPHIVKTMKMSTANVVVVFSNDIDLVPVLDEMLRQNITKKTLIASEAWSTSTVTTMGRFTGTIGFTLYSGIILGFQAFLNKVHPSTSLGKNWVNLLWEQTFNCKFFNDSNISIDVKTQSKQCTGEERLGSVLNSYNDVSSLRVTYNVYNAVHMVAKALEDLRNCNKRTDPFSNSNCAKLWNFEPWQVKQHTKTPSSLALDSHGNASPLVLSIPIPQVSGIGRYLRYRNSDTEFRYFPRIGYRNRKFPEFKLNAAANEE